MLPERHLGLVQASEHGDLRDASIASRTWPSDTSTSTPCVACAAPDRTCQQPALLCSAAAARPTHRARLGRGIHVRLRASARSAGAKRVRRSSTFSPLADEPPPADCDVCWLPGGYPELHAGALASAQTISARARAVSRRRGRCTASAAATWSWGRDSKMRGVRHAMTGLLGHATSFAERKLHLGYREARLRAISPIGPAGRASFAATSFITRRL